MGFPGGMCMKLRHYSSRSNPQGRSPFLLAIEYNLATLQDFLSGTGAYRDEHGIPTYALGLPVR